MTVDKKNQYKLFEKVNTKRLTDFMDCCNTDLTSEKEIYEMLEKFKKCIKNDRIEVKYNYKKITSSGKTYGRLYPYSKKRNFDEGIPCYLSLESVYRDFLLEGTDYKQIDLSNCHQVILEGLFKKFGINCPEISIYNQNRKQILERNKLDKGYIGKCINDKNFKSYLKNGDEKLFNRINECVYNDLIFKLKEHCDFNDLYNDLVKNLEKEKTLENSFVSLVLQTLENRYILTAYEYFQSLGISCDSIIFDALLVLRLYEEKLDEYNEAIYKLFKEKYPFDFKINFKVSKNEINEQIKTIFSRLDDEKINNKKNNDDVDENDLEFVKYSDKDVGLAMFKDLYEFIFKFNGELWLYNKNTKIWTRENEKEKFENAFFMYLEDCNLEVGSKTNRLKACEKTSSWFHFLRQFKTICECELKNDNSKGNLLDSKKGIIPFLNGYYDCINNIFVKSSDDDNNHLNYFTVICNRNFNEKVNNESIKKIKNILLKIYNGNEDDMNEEFSFYCRSLCGHVDDKLFLVCCGLRNSGKGIKTDSFLEAFPGLTSTFNSEEIISNKKEMGDAERRLGFLGTFIKNKLIFGSEIRDDMEIDGTLLKKIASGGDQVTVRSAYGYTNTGRIKGCLVLSAQTIPKSNPSDAFQNMLYYDMPVAFYNEEEYNERMSNGNNNLVTPLLGDPELKNFIKTDEYLDAFTHIVISYYKKNKPIYERLKSQTDNMRNNNDEVFNVVEMLDNVFNCNFKICEGSKVKCSEFHKTFANSKFKAETTSVKVGKYFSSKLKLLKVKIGGNDFYKGIKKIDNPQDNTEFDNEN